jgi:hypothetical protein
MTGRLARLPKAVQRELDLIDSERVVVAAVLTITAGDVTRYEHLGVRFEIRVITIGLPAPPPRICGTQARRNLDGWDEKRKDLPKETRDISSWAPSWHSSGHHLVSRTIEAWQVTHHAARLLTLSATVLEPLKEAAIIRFRIDQPLDRKEPNFANDLMLNLRLLREAVGEARIYRADLSDEDFARLQSVDWELLPQGSADRVLERLGNSGRVHSARMETACERLRVLDRLAHDGFIVGHGKFARYFGAKFGDRLVALENLEYGNALYVFEDDWESLSQLSRTELIKQRDARVRRVPHIPGWQSAIRQLLRQPG